MCVHCTETWCFSCIDRVGTCGCGELTEEGFLRPLEEVEAPPPVRGARPLVPCLSTASSCNLAVCMADTATSDPVGGCRTGGDGHSCSGGTGEGAVAGAVAGLVAASQAAVAALARVSAAAGVEMQAPEPHMLAWPIYGAADEGVADDDGPQCSSTGGGCI